jgi:hypothetical protein
LILSDYLKRLFKKQKKKKRQILYFLAALTFIYISTIFLFDMYFKFSSINFFKSNDVRCSGEPVFASMIILSSLCKKNIYILIVVVENKVALLSLNNNSKIYSIHDDKTSIEISVLAVSSLSRAVLYVPCLSSLILYNSILFMFIKQ